MNKRSALCATGQEEIVIHVRNLRKGEAAGLPAALQNHGMLYLAEDWAWVVEMDGYPGPFALIVTSFCHGWLVLWRLVSISPLPAGIPLNWFLEAHPQVFAEARSRGCVGFLTLLDESRPAEAQMARIAVRLAGGTVLPGQWSMCAGPLIGEGEPR
jgi:hypothetical protein